MSCEELFKRVNAQQGQESQYQISVSMLEIYNEQVLKQALLIATYILSAGTQCM